jgi:hypothetical protein
MQNRYLLILIAFASLCPAQTGPALLSRGFTPETRAAEGGTGLEISVGAFSGYDEGVLTADLARGGGLFQEIESNLRSRRAGARTDLRLDYRLDLRHYTAAGSLDRANHALGLDARFQLSRRLTLMLRNVGSSSSFGGSLQETAGSGSSGFPPGRGPESFDSRTIADTGLVDVVFAPSARTSFSAGGDGFVVQRQSQALLDAVGWRARADAARRYSRHKTVSLSYSFTHFDHTRAFGGADYAVYAVGHSVRLGKNSELDVLAGAGLLRGAGVRTVELDPQTARLLGTPRGAEIFRLHTWAPHIAGAWLERIGPAELRAGFVRQVSDGGGLTGLARQNQGTLSISAHRRRTWRPAATLAAGTYRSLDTVLYNNATALAGGSLARRIGPRTEAVLRYQFAFYNYQEGLLHNFRRHQIAAGVVYYLHDLPNR